MNRTFGGVEEVVFERGEFPIEKAREVLKDDVIAVLGYGHQGPGQALNLKDNGFNVIVGQRKGTGSYQKAVDDEWVPGETLLPLEEAVKRGSVIAYLLSDSGQMLAWDQVKPHLEPGDALYFSHGFGVHFHKQTGIVAPDFVDVLMVAPKGTGSSVRTNFLNGSGINSSIAYKDITGKALERTLAMGVGIGSGYLFDTSFRNEVVSDHFGERAFLLGEIWALVETSYEKLSKSGIGPIDAFVQSSEQATQVILPLIGKGGGKEIYDRARAAGELGTVLEYQKAVQEGTQRILNELYTSVTNGTEAQIALNANSDPQYRSNLDSQLDSLDSSEMWKVGMGVREVRKKKDNQEYGGQITNWGLAGAILGAMSAQYQKLIDEGHKPSEAFNESVEEMTQSLNNLNKEEGIAYLLRECSTTAQVGALEWGPKFKGVLSPIFDRLKQSYRSGTLELSAVDSTNPYIWSVGDISRTLRPENIRAA